MIILSHHFFIFSRRLKKIFRGHFFDHRFSFLEIICLQHITCIFMHLRATGNVSVHHVNISTGRMPRMKFQCARLLEFSIFFLKIKKVSKNIFALNFFREYKSAQELSAVELKKSVHNFCSGRCRSDVKKFMHQ